MEGELFVRRPLDIDESRMQIQFWIGFFAGVIATVSLGSIAVKALL